MSWECHFSHQFLIAFGIGRRFFLSQTSVKEPYHFTTARHCLAIAEAMLKKHVESRKELEDADDEEDMKDKLKRAQADLDR